MSTTSCHKLASMSALDTMADWPMRNQPQRW